MPDSKSLPALLTLPAPGRETVALGVWITRGAAHDPEHLAGATHLVEHLTLRACGGHDRRSLALAVDRLGGEVDAWTGSELMGISINTTADALDEALDLLVEAVLAPTFEAEDVDLERRVTLAELDLMADDPAERVEEALLVAAWGDHPLARPVIGTRDSLELLTPAVLKRHHASLVAPGGMLAAVVGDVAPEEVAARLARLPLGCAPTMSELPDLRWLGKHLDLSREGTDQVHARLAFEALAVGDPRLPALVILNKTLGDGAASRLFQRLREDEGLTYDIWSGSVLRRLGGLLEVGWACAPQAFPDARRLVLEELGRIAGDLDEEEVEVAKEGLLRGLQMDVESPGGLCALDVGETLDRGRRFDLAATRREFEAVSVEAVRALAAEILRPDRMASAVCGPEGIATRVA
ncbi:MAG: M16 family metallopeptidase [Thermoanaerobaculales bacterium]